MKKKILIVDDLIENIQVLISIFEKYEPNYILYQATDTDLAFMITKKIKPDLIISDWDMPVKDGIAFIKELKKDKELKHIPVIMATGIMTTVKNLQAALDAGAVDYLRKPVNEVELIVRTHSAINLAESYNKIMEKKNKELIENTLLLLRNNKFNKQITEKLNELINQIPQNNKQTIKTLSEIITQINQKIKADSWQRFEIAFNDVHEDFYKSLLSNFPNLTSSEIKLSAFIKLGLNTKDIASILFITPESVKVSRSRLRKKLKLKQETNLQLFLSKY